jgi:hypothetical protein
MFMKPKLALTKRIAEIYAQGDNVIKYLRSLDGRESNTIEDIMISYDFQAGSYIRAYDASPDYLERYTNELASLMRNLGDFGTALEAGCGEATTLSVLGKKLPASVCLGGFDIAWSRIKLGMEFARRMDLKPTLFCSDLFEIPLADNSVDIVYTSHSIEPNGGREAEAIRELSRVARKWLVLLEPAYDLALPEAKARMEAHGYVRNLADVIRGLGLDLVRHELFPVFANPLNPTGLYLVRIRSTEDVSTDFRFRCPVSGCSLIPGPDAYYAPESMLAYPIVGDVPYLIGNHAILATKFTPGISERKP